MGMKKAERLQLQWERYTQDSLHATKGGKDVAGVYFLNEELKDRVHNSSDVGFYIYTTQTQYAKSQFKCGLTTVGCVSRIKDQKSAAVVDNLYIVDWIPSELAAKDSKSDLKIHKELDRRGITEWTGYGSEIEGAQEWSIFPDKNPGEIWWEYINSNGAQDRIDLGLTIWQSETIKDILVALSNGKKRILAELAARFGKTNTFLSLLDIYGSKVMVIGSYVTTVAASFRKECRVFSQFENYTFLDMRSPDFQEEFKAELETDNKIVVFASLHSSDNVNKNMDIVREFDDKFVVIDEADFGAHTNKVVPKVKNITGESPLILATGTNADRAGGPYNPDAQVGVTYFDMLMMRDR